jgi:hypothetical protein
MSRWELLLSRGSDRWSVPKSRWSTPAAETGTAGPLQWLEPVPDPGQRGGGLPVQKQNDTFGIFVL